MGVTDPGSNQDVEVLQGGVGNAGEVVRVGTDVLRPLSPHWRGIHAFLRHLHDVGFTGVPRVIGVESGARERLAFIPGDVPIPPFPDWSATGTALTSTAALLRGLHDAARTFTPPPDATWSEELADPDPGVTPVLCHNDVCPENVVFRSGRAVALLDFEFAAPGRPLWDLAALASMCVPLDTPADAARNGPGRADPISGLRAVAAGHGLDRAERLELLDVLDARMANGGVFVKRRVDAGEQAFIEMWEAMGGQARYDRRRDWFSTMRPTFTAALVDPDDTATRARA